MKKALAWFVLIAMMISLAACGKADQPQSTPAVPKREYDQSDPTAVLGEITNDFDDTITSLSQKLEETFTAVGTTYEDYQKNKGFVDEWVELVFSESEALFTRTKDNSIAYFKLIAADSDHKYREFCEEALDKYYDTVYDKAMDEYYDSLYDDAMDDLYDEYYNGIVNDAVKDIEYSEWAEASDECYKTWTDANSAIYEKWSNENSYIYGLWSAMNKAFCWNDNYDVDTIVAEYEKEKADQERKQAEESAKEYVDLEVLYDIEPDGKAAVVGFSGEGNRVTIDSTFDGHDVVRIADAAFENCSTLEDIIMWADVEEIGDSAFAGCTGLTEISIPGETVWVGNHAFDGCTNLENLVIWGDPDIGEYAFSNCVSLTEINIGGDTKNVGAHAFEGCTGATSLVIWGAEIIGDYAFAGCTGIEDVSVPSDVLSIGNHAFDGCTALTSVVVWGDDTAIGEEAFANCPNLSDAPAPRGTVLACPFRDTAVSGNSDATESSVPSSSDTGDEIRPEFKEAMDSYEAFYTEYCEFMKEYSENPTDLTFLAKYADMLVKAEEMDEAFEGWDEDELSNEELKYYLDVNDRVMKMLVDVAG